MVSMTLATPILSAASANLWFLFSSYGLETSIVDVLLSTQANNTSQPLNFVGGTHSKTYIREVSGDTKPENGPPWAEWLDPVSYTTQNYSTSWPQGAVPLNKIPVGYTYYFGIKYELQTGYQSWILDPADIYNTRSRYWQEHDGDYELAVP